MSIAQRIKSTAVGQTAVAYGQAKGGSYAMGLAFGSFMTMFPLILGILTIIGLVIHDPATEAKIQTAIVGVFPSDAHAQLLKALQGVKRNAGVVGVVSVLLLIWSGTGLFASMEFALTQIFGSRQRDLLRQRVMGLVMMIIFVLATVVAVTANNAAGFIPFMPVAGFLIGAVVMIALLTLIYRFVPNRSFKLSEVWQGAVLAGFLIEVLTLVFPIYARLAHGFNTYGQQFALFFLIATWLYLLSQFLLLGAVFNRVRLGRPADQGLASAPEQDAHATQRPAEAIERVRAEGEGGELAERGDGGRGDGARGASGAGRAGRQPALSEPLPVPRMSLKQRIESGAFQVVMGGMLLGGLAGWVFRRRRRPAL